ncbi:MAG: dicarboxylate/amino acid:cation symporter [bacterium]|nr:dicarboxylate/amino acid:cation symporter [bacterium]
MTENNTTADGFRKTHQKILIGIVVGIVLGVLMGGFLPEFALNFSMLGAIFLNLLMMIVVPLVMLSIVVGITNLGDIRNIGSIGRRTVLYYFVTTGLSVLVGIILVNIVQPGKGITIGEKQPGMEYRLHETESRRVHIVSGVFSKKSYNDSFELQLVDQKVKGVIVSFTPETIEVKQWKRIDPAGIIYLKGTGAGGEKDIPVREGGESLLRAVPELQRQGQGLAIVLPMAKKIVGKKDNNVLSTIKEVFVGNKKTGRQGLIPRNVFRAMTNMEILPLIFFSLILGAALSVLGESGKKVIEVFSICNDAVMRMVHWIMILAPIGIFGIISARIGEAGGFSGFLPELFALGKYSATVIGGLLIHACVVLPLILYFVGKRNPFRFIAGIGPALLNAFSTASSSATLPLTMESVEEQNGISMRTSGFVLPIGATINMDGTALYEAVAAIFIAQVYGISLGPLEQIIIFLTATLAAIGAAGIPEAGLVTMVIVLKAVGLPIEGIGLILTIDWFLDRCRTTVNVMGDSVGAGVVETLENGGPQTGV